MRLILFQWHLLLLKTVFQRRPPGKLDETRLDDDAIARPILSLEKAQSIQNIHHHLKESKLR